MILNFDSPHLTDGAIQMAKSFLVKCLKPSTCLETFDELGVAEFDYSALKVDFKKLYALQQISGSTSKEVTTKYSYGSKPRCYTNEC